MKSIFRACILIFFQCFVAMASESQNRTTMDEQDLQLTDREPVVAGSFYDAHPESLKRVLEQFFRNVKGEGPLKDLRALVARHAGYVFSGQVAAAAFGAIDPETVYQRVFLIGSSHHTGFDGASIYNKGHYKTPLGTVPVDLDLANVLIDECTCFTFREEAHTSEHSLEVQLPFLQYHLKHPFRIIPIVLGTQSPSMSKEIAQALKPFFTEGNLFVISTDLSHYPSYDNAVEADQRVLDAMLTNSPEALLKALKENEKQHYSNLLTSMCGWPSALTLLNITSDMDDIVYHQMMYQNSGDTRYGDKHRVVGYGSLVVTQKKKSLLTDDEKVALLSLARETIEHRLKHGDALEPNPVLFPGAPSKPLGAFVSLHDAGGALRGCIGRFQPDQPLYLVIRDMAISAAFTDYRFKPVKMDELAAIDIEISVLTPLREIQSIDEIEMGRHGIYMEKNGRSGTFLPQVAVTTGWTKTDFLGYCARDKARIGWDGWKTATLYTFEAIIFSEHQYGRFRGSDQD